MIPPVLKTENFVIRAFEEKDLKVFADYRSQEMVAKHQSWTNYTYEDAVELFESMNYSTFVQKETVINLQYHRMTQMN